MVDWSLAQQPDIVGNALKYRAAGQDAAESAYDRNALMRKNQQEQLERTRIKGIRQQALGQYAAGDTAGARNTALQGDQIDLVETLGKLDEPARAQAKARVERSAAVLASLGGLPQEQRAAAFQSIAPRLISEGFKPEELQSFDLSDAGIQTGLGLAMSAKDILDGQLKDKTFQVSRMDKEQDNKRADMLASETVRNNQFQNGISAGQLGVARGNLALRGQEANKTAQGRPIPPVIVNGYAENVTALNKIDSAIAALQKSPKAVGLARGMGDTINQRFDPGGVDARAALSDIGSQKLHDRSGAAVSASESPRLMPFIPQVTDTKDTAIKKLQRLRQEYVSNNGQIEVQFGQESGYQPLRMRSPQSAPQSSSPQASKPVKQMSNAEIKAKLGL